MTLNLIARQVNGKDIQFLEESGEVPKEQIDLAMEVANEIQHDNFDLMETLKEALMYFRIKMDDGALPEAEQEFVTFGLSLLWNWLFLSLYRHCGFKADKYKQELLELIDINEIE